MNLTLIHTDEFPTELRVFTVGNSSTNRDNADLIIPGEDLTTVEDSAIEITRRIQEWKDKASVAIKDTAVGTSESYVGEITSGDRIEFWVPYASRIEMVPASTMDRISTPDAAGLGGRTHPPVRVTVADASRYRSMRPTLYSRRCRIGSQQTRSRIH
ncbi:hypothetical protein [Natrinema halophilum]|uniref:hypothetical protein n=1 Tax=Natrinema halophilum TaxID=1699371 RepID=UPI001F1BF531|nr:hypothetical protein [Natrinema halophilum]UHQ95978.1 hypothetical protein HYG82_21090 [Natrinema halophilum]